MKQEIIIDIYSDTVCPWCYIGLNKLKSAMFEYKKSDIKLTWRPFQLNPDMPINGMNRQKYLENKFDGRDGVKKIYKAIYNQGLSNNIHFQFEKISIMPNSFASHKLLALAHEFNKQTEVVESLFYDYFIEGVDIGKKQELIRIAKLHNFFNKDTENYLESREDKKNLLAEEKQARKLGIKGVPCFILNKEFVLFGAQNKNIFLEAFDKITNGY